MYANYEDVRIDDQLIIVFLACWLIRFCAVQVFTLQASSSMQSLIIENDDEKHEKWHPFFLPKILWLQSLKERESWVVDLHQDRPKKDGALCSTKCAGTYYRAINERRNQRTPVKGMFRKSRLWRWPKGAPVAQVIGRPGCQKVCLEKSPLSAGPTSLSTTSGESFLRLLFNALNR